MGFLGQSSRFEVTVLVKSTTLFSFLIVYFDDILVYRSTWEEHISHLMQVLETL
jgi:hypothetical protein